MIDEIVRRILRRREIAAAVYEKRNQSKGSGLDPRTRNEAIRDLVGVYRAPEKPTPENLQREAMRAWRFGVEPIQSRICGEDDCEGDRKECARDHALEIWRMIGRPLPA